MTHKLKDKSVAIAKKEAKKAGKGKALSKALSMSKKYG